MNAKHVSTFTSPLPLVIGARVEGMSSGRSYAGAYRTAWSGLYQGVRPSEHDGKLVHFFTEGIIGVTPQNCFALPVSNFSPTAPLITMAAFFALDEVRILQGIQMRHPHGSAAHEGADDRLAQIAAAYGAQEFVNHNDYNG